ncbi:hypothetical protein RFEPED_0483 [Rickettsia felis str. Pedreira]|uniref:Uncharacterized protein n=1 Tax=Rickettsia felis str. Pedreira TaxID=1359196 RepID=A0A0F3MQV6_RICFI|nr:hypothetical protein RFEPED_0483 [Rickettsia felis str. Pedreira]
MRGKTVSFDEAILGVLLHEIATQPTAARNDDENLTTSYP